ncbi:Alpha/Beta hydrolase protein [Stachybotrys elegans]|uniref:Alpha/Beta hydrolase protein n=1 Tax=Stachybotrys elegans TaxID=80388 RepID=A0A8K0SDS7_9HYPO|nr:Alpha/Beta hydrolase protein [Stachybotrys elegans]
MAAGSALANPSHTYYPPAANCQEFNIPVDVAPEVIQFNLPRWGNDYELVDFLALATTRQTPDSPSIVGETVTMPATYLIAASFCTPKKATEKAKTVILATHGIGQARSHWNSPFRPNEYNFVQFAIDQGYSVFFYDRLGQGDSQKISGYVNQINIQVDILKELSRLVRSGHYTNAIGAPEKLALMGFSFGSFITHAAVGTSPEIADAVVLTAIGLNTTGINTNGLVRSFVPRIANLQDNKYAAFDSGYLTWVDRFAQINTYFKFPFYDDKVADFAEQAKQPFGFTEFFTFPSGNGGNLDASNFTGPALAITGQQDYIVCDGNCEGIFIEPASTFYRNAQPFVPYLQPNASHNINFHYNATGAYGVITKFLDENL